MTTTYAATVRHTGLSFGEAPRWHDGRLWFSDFYRHGVYSLGDDGERLEQTVDEQPSGLGWSDDGTLLVVSMTDQRVLAIAPDGTRSVRADVSALCGYWANDMVVAADGTAYVSNFGFDLDTWLEEQSALAEGAARTAPTPTCLIQVSPDGTARAAADELLFPNGLVLSEDGHTLIAAESLALRLTAFDVAADGSLHDRRVFAQLDGVVPDGICLDAEGQVWVANAIGTECVRVANGGEVTARVQTERTCFACALGGEDRTTLFAVTAAASTAKVAAAGRDGQIETATVEVPGAGRP